ncbi:Polynucleotide 5'-hydroxyl-kinase grc3 [Rhodotorula sphaerocarpa]
MAGATKGSKRSRNSEESPAPAALPASSAAAAPPSPSVNSTGQRPLSAVAARRAAREASLATPHVARPAQTATTSSSAPRSATKVPATELNSHPDSSPDEQVGSDADSDAASSSDNAPERRPEPPLRKKSKTAARYFAAEEKRPHARRAATTGGGGDFMMLEDAETSVAEPDNGNESSEAATPRSSRRRREKPAFLDPECASTFEPVAGVNFFETTGASYDGSLNAAAFFLLREDETLLVRGVCSVTPVFGTTSVLHATLRAATSTTNSVDARDFGAGAAYPLFAPSSHPVPPIRARSSLTEEAPPGKIHLADGQTGKGLATDRTMIGGSTWRLLTAPEPSFAKLRDEYYWDAALRSCLPPSPFEQSEESFWRSEPFVALVEGPKRAGKSTFAKFLAHELLDRFEAVAYLDTDLGQPEFTAPGLVSLTVLRRPALGPSFTHTVSPLVSHFLGSTSPAANPAQYLAACEALVTAYRLEVEYSLADEAVQTVGRRRRPRANVAEDLSAPHKSRERVPLVVNTSGWVKGAGAEMLAKLKQVASPTRVFALGDSLSEPVPYGAPPAPHSVVALPAIGDSPLESKWSPADLRNLALASYFYRSEAQTAAPRWDVTRPLLSRPVLPFPWGKEASSIAGVHVVDTTEIRYEHVLHALNGSIVGLIADVTSEADAARDRRPFPYDPRASPPPPSSSRALGLALVHSITPGTETLHLLTPVAPGELARAGALRLVKGALDTPLVLLCDFTASPEDTEVGLAGLEWADVPYLTVDAADGAGRSRVRRNLMRKAHF